MFILIFTIQNYSEKVGTIEDFKSIRFLRTFLTGFEDPIVCRFASFELVRGEWRRYNNTLIETENVIEKNILQKAIFRKNMFPSVKIVVLATKHLLMVP